VKTRNGGSGGAGKAPQPLLATRGTKKKHSTAPASAAAAGSSMLVAIAELKPACKASGRRPAASARLPALAPPGRLAARRDWIAGALGFWRSVAPEAEIEKHVARAARRFARVERFWRDGREDEEQVT